MQSRARKSSGRRWGLPNCTLLLVLILLSLTSVACGAEPTSVAEPVPTETLIAPTAELSQLTAGGLQAGADGEIACQPNIGGLVDLQAGADAPVLEGDFELGVLGEAGAQQLAAGLLPVDETFCGADLSPETREALAEAAALVKAGDSQGAMERLRQHVDEMSQASAAGGRLAAPVVDHALGQRILIRTYMAMAAFAQKNSDENSGQEFMDAARETLQEMAKRDLPQANVKEALLIAMEAQLLADESVEIDATERARKAATDDFENALAGFSPCTATDAQVKDLLGILGVAQLVGAGDGLWSQAERILDTTREARISRASGEEPIGCGPPAAFEWTGTHNFGWKSTGSAWTCNGRYWKMDLSFEVSVENGDYEMSGSAPFPMLDGTSSGNTIPMTGVLTVINGTADLTDFVNFSIMLNDSQESGHMNWVSSGAGTIVYGDGEVDEWGVIWPDDPGIDFTLHPYDGCEA